MQNEIHSSLKLFSESDDDDHYYAFLGLKSLISFLGDTDINHLTAQHVNTIILSTIDCHLRNDFHKKNPVTESHGSP
jgi:hypothetical protein